MNQIQRQYLKALETTPESEHCRGSFYSEDGEACCAIGLAYRTFGYEVYKENLHLLLEEPYESSTLRKRIIKWNDIEKLTFKQIGERLSQVWKGEEHGNEMFTD
jgi:hypothetical protein